MDYTILADKLTLITGKSWTVKKVSNFPNSNYIDLREDGSDYGITVRDTASSKQLVINGNYVVNSHNIFRGYHDVINVAKKKTETTIAKEIFTRLLPIYDDKFYPALREHIKWEGIYDGWQSTLEEVCSILNCPQIIKREQESATFHKKGVDKVRFYGSDSLAITVTLPIEKALEFLKTL